LSRRTCKPPELTFAQRGAYRSRPVRPKVAFLHVPKTGGTSLNAILSDAFFGRMQHVAVSEAAFPTSSANAAVYDFLGGHYSFRQIAEVEWSYDLITILRHPLDRFYSQYGHMRRVDPIAEGVDGWPEHMQALYQKANEGDLSDFLGVMLQRKGSLNDSVLALSGLPLEADLTKHRDAALQNLATRFYFCTLPQIGRLLRLIEDRCGLTGLDLRQPLNVSEPRVRLSPEEEAMVIEAADHDMRLYEFAQAKERARYIDEFARLRMSLDQQAPPSPDTSEIRVADHKALLGFHAPERVGGKSFRYTGPDDCSLVFLGHGLCGEWLEIDIINSVWPERTHELMATLDNQLVGLQFRNTDGTLTAFGRLPPHRRGPNVLSLHVPFTRLTIDQNGRAFDERMRGIAVSAIRVVNEARA